MDLRTSWTDLSPGRKALSALAVTAAVGAGVYFSYLRATDSDAPAWIPVLMLASSVVLFLLSVRSTGGPDRG